MTQVHMTAPFRVAILGAGIGEQHLNAYLALPGRFTVKVICDADRARAQALAVHAPGCRISGDAEATIADPECDVIDICLPPRLHGPVALAALAAGKHVICEKPLAASVVEADRMAAAAAAADRILMPVFQYRYGHAIQTMKTLIERGIAGKALVGTLETHWNRGADYYAVPWRGAWEGERGGAVLSHAIHVHDLAAFFFGRITHVSAMTDTRVNSIETEDCAAITFRTESGALVTSSITLGSATDMSRLRLVFDELTAESGRSPYAPGQDEWRFTAREPGRQGIVDETLAQINAENARIPQGYAGQFAAFADALEGTDAAVVSIGDGVRSIELVAAIYEAARTGTRLQLPLDRSLPICANWVRD